MTQELPFFNINKELFHQINVLSDFFIYQYDTRHSVSDFDVLFKLTNFFDEQGDRLTTEQYIEESQKVLSYINSALKDSPSYNMVYSSFTQIFFKGLKQDKRWSIINAPDFGFDKNIIKEGIKDFFSLNFSVDPQHINPTFSLFSSGHLLLTNVNNAQRKTFLEEHEFKSLFNKEESLDIATVVFKYHPSFILSLHNFCAFQNLENKTRFVDFMSEVWNRNNNSLEDIQLTSSFTTFYSPIHNSYNNKEEELFEKITDFCLKPNNKKYLIELNQLLQQPDEFFYKNNENFSFSVAQDFNVKDHIDDTRTGHRLFFHEHRNSEIFSQDKEKKFSKISSLLREIELHTILDKKSLSNNTHKKVKI